MRYKPTYKQATYALLTVFIALPLLYCAYKGTGVVLDEIAQSRIDIPLQVTSCMAEFNEQVQGLKLQ